jgi:DEAD/DEAH box helicase domain-containing protein
MAITEVFFDIETKKLFKDITTDNPADLGVSVVSVYKRILDSNFKESQGQMFSFWEADFSQMWPLFSNADRIIGFNSLSFDVPALIPLSPYDFKKLNHFDILDQIKKVLGFRLSLDAVASQSLGHSKSDIGTNAVLYWQQHSPESLEKLKKYCEMDVLVTRDVYDYVLANKFLKYKDRWNTLRQVDLDFSYPPPPPASQMGLF